MLLPIQERIRALKWHIKGNIAGIKYPCVVDIKYDGMPVHVSSWAGKPPLLTTEAGIERVLPHCIMSVTGEFLAEWIYKDGKNGMIWPLLSAIHKDIGSTSIKIFDVLSKQMQPLSKRIAYKESLITPSLSAQSWYVNSRAELATISRDVREAGYEGLVLKNLHESFPLQSWVKLKPPTTIRVEITKVESSRVEFNYLGTKVGANLPSFSLCVGETVEIKHYGVTANGSLRNAVILKKV